MNEIGIKSLYYIELLRESWQKLQRINANIPKNLKLYGLFLVKILDDKELGEEMLRKSRNTQISANSSKNDSFYSQSTPSIMISGDHVRVFCNFLLQFIKKPGKFYEYHEY